VTTLLYSYLTTEDDGEELRYSLRSVEENLHMGTLDVMVVGDKPSWFVNGIHVEGNPTRDKATNMMFNVHAACSALQSLNVLNAVYLSDDYLLMYPQEDVFPIHRGTLEDHIRAFRKFKDEDDWYRVALDATFNLLTRAGHPEPLSWEMHLPMPLNVEMAVKSLAPFLKADPAPFWRTMYGNLVGFPRPAYRSQDGLYYGQSPMRIGTPWVSAIPSQWEGHMHRRARRMFKRPSRWEG